MTRGAPSRTPLPSSCTFTTLPEPSDEYIPYPPQIDKSRKPDFRNLFIEHTRVVSLKNQMVKYTQIYGGDIKKAASRGAVHAYKEFRVLLDNGDEGKPLTLANGKKWFRDRLKWISDRIMEFSDDEAWREKIQKQGKKGKFVLNSDKDDGEDGGMGGGADGAADAVEDDGKGA